MTDDQFKKLLSEIRKTDTHVQDAKKQPSVAVDMLFRALTGVCATGIGWLVITMPVMRDNIKDLKQDVARIEKNTQNWFTRQDFETEIQALVNEVQHNSSSLSESKYFMEQTRERLTRIEQKIEDWK